MSSPKRQIVMLSGVCVCAMLGHVPLAHAYLDPGTGSMMLQAIVGAVAAAAIVGRLYWSKTKDFFMRRRHGADSLDGASRGP